MSQESLRFFLGTIHTDSYALAEIQVDTHQTCQSCFYLLHPNKTTESAACGYNVKKPVKEGDVCYITGSSGEFLHEKN